MTPERAYGKLAGLARPTGRPLDEVGVLYVLESFLRRLQRTSFSDDFVLKGGVLLAAFHLRRPTRDIDMQALDFQLDEQHVKTMVSAVANVDSGDGVELDANSVTVEQIRDEEEYSGLRVKLRSNVGRLNATIALDISTGDPIWPEPKRVIMPQLLGGDFELLGFPLPMVIAEKSITILQRGTVSTRWRDLMDLRNFALSLDFTYTELRGAVEAVAKSRSVTLVAAASVTDGWAEVAQARWSAWRNRRGDYADRTLAGFDEQLDGVLKFIDPVLDGSAAGLIWSSHSQSWT